MNIRKCLKKIKTVNIGLCCIATVLLVSLGFNYLLLKTIKKSFVKLQFARIFPLGYSYRNEDLTKKHIHVTKSPPTVIIVGDSRAQMWDTTELKERFKVTNIGHGGQTTAQTRLQISESNIPNGDWVILQVGINDIHSIGAFENLRPTIINNCKDNIAEIVRILQKMNYKIILTTLFPPSDPPLYRRQFWETDSNIIIDEINNFLRTLSLSNHIYMVDAYELLKNDTNNKINHNYEDKDFYLHVNKKAYSELNREVIKIINKH